MVRKYVKSGYLTTIGTHAEESLRDFRLTALECSVEFQPLVRNKLSLNLFLSLNVQYRMQLVKKRIRPFKCVLR